MKCLCTQLHSFIFRISYFALFSFVHFLFISPGTTTTIAPTAISQRPNVNEAHTRTHTHYERRFTPNQTALWRFSLATRMENISRVYHSLCLWIVVNGIYMRRSISINSGQDPFGYLSANWKYLYAKCILARMKFIPN